MQIDITGKGIDISDALRTYATERLNRMLERDFTRPQRAHVVLDVERHLHKAEIIVNYKGANITASASANGNMYAALDAAAGNLRRRLRQLANRSTGRPAK